ncbi:hypothetical protein AOLI_G00033150 [Acnodon oligacanthus]
MRRHVAKTQTGSQCWADLSIVRPAGHNRPSDDLCVARTGRRETPAAPGFQLFHVNCKSCMKAGWCTCCSNDAPLLVLLWIYILLAECC